MKKITILSIVTATLLFTACGEKAKESATESADKAVEATKEAVTHAVDATKEATDKALEATKKAAEATKETVVKTVDDAKESVTTAVGTVTASAVDTVINAAGKEAYGKCISCHGLDGKTLALGKSPIIAGQSKEELVTKLKGYKAGTINVAGMGNLMKGQVTSMDDTTIEALAAYISALK